MLDEEFYIESKLKGCIEIDSREYAIGKNNFDIDLLRFLLKFDILTDAVHNICHLTDAVHGPSVEGYYRQFRLSVPIRAVYKPGEPAIELPYIFVNENLMNKI